jgi:regulatory protein
LYKKTKPGVRTGKDQLGNYVTREYEGISPAVAERVKDKMLEKGYVNDEKFARWFVENRRVRKGASHKRLLLELHKKGIKRDLAERVMGELEEDGFGRDEKAEMMKVIEKKRAKYNDSDLVRYLVRQGFRYSDAREAVAAAGSEDLA